MKKTIYIICLVLMTTMTLVGCGEKEQPIQNTLDKVEQSNHPQIEVEIEIEKETELPVVDTPVASYTTISAEEAKSVMDSDAEFIILDVRSKDEYDEGHIENAILLPVDNIENEAGPVIGGKDKTVLVYCRSGNRSKMASAKLVELGYTDVRNFGGIIDWPYEIVK